MKHDALFETSFNIILAEIHAEFPFSWKFKIRHRCYDANKWQRNS